MSEMGDGFRKSSTLPTGLAGTAREASGKTPKTRQPLLPKIYRFSEFRICGISTPSRPCQRGASRSSRDAGRGAVDAVAPARLRGDRGGRPLSPGTTRIRHGAVAAVWSMVWGAHTKPRALRSGRPRTEKSCGPDARGSGVKPRGDAAANRHAHRTAAR